MGHFWIRISWSVSLTVFLGTQSEKILDLEIRKGSFQTLWDPLRLPQPYMALDFTHFLLSQDSSFFNKVAWRTFHQWPASEISKIINNKQIFTKKCSFSLLSALRLVLKYLLRTTISVLVWFSGRFGRMTSPWASSWPCVDGDERWVRNVDRLSKIEK